EYLKYAFVDAASCIFFGLDGQIDRGRTDAAIAAALAENERIVIPGFYGRLPSGRVKVMTRGGSDITGALAAAAVNADVYENWTDVSGILMADPRIVADPQPIAKVTYAELRELAFMGASVLHEDSIQPVKERGIALNIRNTNRPQDPGTMIVENIGADGDSDRLITGIAGRRNFTIITVQKRNINISVTLRQTLEIMDRYKAAAEHINLGLDSFALVTATTALGDGLYDVIAEIQKTCHPDDVRVQDGLALVAAVGRKMTFRPGTSGKLFQALGEHGVNIRTIAQGADELSIIVGVENSQFETAIRVLYDGFAV
ncbi:MAG: aspartate kinase, partial [Oscillospiraceae bacterium]|nr:aspartate kinase [Oscillospiraceae bacterium]